MDVALIARLLSNTTDAENADFTNITSWVTLEEVEHFLGDPTALHATALVLGTIAILFSKRFPHVLAIVASISLGLWTGLVVQDRQIYNQPLLGLDMPEGEWVPICVGLLVSCAVVALTLLVWRIALAMLVGGLLMLLSFAICRLANVSPQKIMQLGSSVLSMYRIVGAVVLVVTILAGALLAKRFHKAMFSFASAHLGTLLLLSGVSFFAQEAGGSEAPFSLLDDLARIFSEVRSGNCYIWEDESGEDLPEGCDCSEKCQTEIIAWIASSLVVLGGRVLLRRVRKKKDKADSEENAPLTKTTSALMSSPGEPVPEVVGAARA
jgi:hypothetical protein